MSGGEGGVDPVGVEGDDAMLKGECWSVDLPEEVGLQGQKGEDYRTTSIWSGSRGKKQRMIWVKIVEEKNTYKHESSLCSMEISHYLGTHFDASRYKLM